MDIIFFFSKFWTQDFLSPNLFQPQFLEPELCGPHIFVDTNLGPKIYFTHIFNAKLRNFEKEVFRRDELTAMQPNCRLTSTFCDEFSNKKDTKRNKFF